MALTQQQYIDWIDQLNRVDYRVFVVALISHSGTSIYLSDQPYLMGNGIVCDNWIIETPYIEQGLDGSSFGTIKLVDMLENELGNQYPRGWKWILYYGDAAWPFADFKQISAGIISDVTRSGHIYTLTLNQFDSKLDKPILTDASSILCIGSCYNFEPILINGATLQYQLNNGEVSFIDVCDKGVLLNSGVNKNLTNGTFTLNNAPAGTITAIASTANQTLESAILRLAQMAGYSGVYYLNVSAARRAYVCGLIIKADGTTYRDAIQQIADSISAYVIENPNNNALTIMCLSTTPPFAALTDDQIIDGSIKQIGILSAVNKVTIGYTKNYRVMDQAEIAASVFVNNWGSANQLMQERSETTTSIAIADSVGYTEINIDTVLRNLNDADSEKYFIVGKRNYDRRIYTIQLHDIANLINVGDFLYLSSTAIPFSMGYVQKIRRWSSGLLSDIEILEL